MFQRLAIYYAYPIFVLLISTKNSTNWESYTVVSKNILPMECKSNHLMIMKPKF